MPTWEVYKAYVKNSNPELGVDIEEAEELSAIKYTADGGHDYLKRCGNFGDWEDLSKVEFVEENNDN